MLVFNSFTKDCRARGRNGEFAPHEVHLRENDSGEPQICIFSKASGYNPPMVLEGPLAVLLAFAEALARELREQRTQIQNDLQGLDPL